MTTAGACRSAVTASALVKPMWPGGPNRLWSVVRTTSSQTSLESGGFAGLYVCGRCNRPTVGVYRVIAGRGGVSEWLCGRCKTGRSHRGKLQPKKTTTPPGSGAWRRN